MPGLIEQNMLRSQRKALKEWGSIWTAHVLKNVFGPPKLTAAYSLKIVPSDFFLSGHIKEKRSDCNCANSPLLLTRFAGIFSSIDKAMLISVFKSLIKRLQ